MPVAPNKPRISELKATSVKVHWDSLTNDGAEHVRSWGIQTRQPVAGGGFTNWETVGYGSRDDRSVLLEDLTASTLSGQNVTASHYQVRVFARAQTDTCGQDQCQRFWSPSSDERGFNMRTLQPTAPAAPTLSNPQTMPQRIDVSWSAPDWLGQQGAILHYDVQVRVGNAWHESRPRTPPRGNDTSTLTLTGYEKGTADCTLQEGSTTVCALEPGTEYRVRVRAVGRGLDAMGNQVHRVGPWSAPSSFLETLPGAPGAPDAPTVSRGRFGQRDSEMERARIRRGRRPSTTTTWRYGCPAGATATWGTGRTTAPTATNTFTGLNYYGGGRTPSSSRPAPTTRCGCGPTTGSWTAGERRRAPGGASGRRRVAFRTAAGAPTGLIAIPQDGGARLLWTGPAGADQGDVSHYTVEHATNADFNGAQTVEAVAVQGVQVSGDWVLNPYRDDADKGAGKTFRLLFLTSDMRNAHSSNIADYNAFVQGQAGGGHEDIQGFSGEFRALASTASVDARANTATTQNPDYTGVPIYWLNGAKLADDYADLYDGNWGSNQWRNQAGTAVNVDHQVWTGSNIRGVAKDGAALGEGAASGIGRSMTQSQELDAGNIDTGNSARLYALSPLITVVTPSTTAVSAEDADLTVTGLTNGTETHFRVRAVRRAGGTDTSGDWSDPAKATPSGAVDYDSDNDGLIEISNLEQLNAVRWDLEGLGQPATGHEIDYALAFPVPMEGMGCPTVQGDTGGCSGYELAASLDFAGSEWASGAGWLPIGDPDNEDATPETYGGVFDGNGRTIANLYINRNGENMTRAGLFDGIRWGAEVRDLGLPDVDVNGLDGVGALAGINNGTVRRSWSTGSVEGLAANVGGLVGWNGDNDLIVDSWSAATVSGGGNTGGLAGRNKGTVRGSYATGSVSSIGVGSGNYIGGLVGWNDSGSILRSYAEGPVQGDGNALGGLAGHNSGTVTAAYATGTVNVRAGHSGGGLVGWNNGGSVTSSYATGTVNAAGGTANVGGLVGINQNNGTVTDSYFNRDSSTRIFGIGSDDTDNNNGVGGAEVNTVQSTTVEDLQAPTGNTGIYATWSVDSWDFGTATEYPALKADHDGDGSTTWQEFGLQRIPGPVTGLAAARDSSGDIVVTWSAPVSPGSGVFNRYEFRAGSDGPTFLAEDDWGPASGSSYTFTPAADTGYTVEVRVRNTVTQGNRSIDNVGPESRIQPPTAPGDLLLAPRTEPADDQDGNPLYDDEGNRLYEGFIGVSWSAPGACSVTEHTTESACEAAGQTWTADAGVTGYSVQYRNTTPYCSDPEHTTQPACEGAGGTWTAAADTWSDAGWSAGDGLAVDIGGLTVGTTYDVRVAAVSALGVSPFATPEEPATPTQELRAPSEPRNVQVFPAAGGLLVTWDPPLDLGNPIFEEYVFQIKPTDDWDCATKPTDDPNVFTVWTGEDADDPESSDFPLWVAIYCVYLVDPVDPMDSTNTLPSGYYRPDFPSMDGWAKVTYNLSGPSIPGGPWGPNAFEFIFPDFKNLETMVFQVRMRAVGGRVEDPPDSSTFVELVSAWSPVMTGTPAPRPPSAPLNLALTAGHETIDAAWNDPQDPGSPEMDGWVFQWRESGPGVTGWSNTVVLLEDDESGGSHDLSMLTNDTPYDVRVAAFHNTAITAPANVTVTYVLAAPATGTDCLTDDSSDCYVVVASESIGDYATGTATPGEVRKPGVPRNLQLRPDDQTIAAVWEAPQDVGNPALDGYVVRWRTAAFCSDSEYDTESACNGAGATWTAAADTWSYAVQQDADGSDYELGGIVVAGVDDDENPVCLNEDGTGADVEPNSDGECVNEDGIENDVAYEVQVAAFHNLLPGVPIESLSEDIRVFPVLDVGDVPEPEDGQPAPQLCPANGIPPTVDCYVVIPAENIGDYTAAATATPQSRTILLTEAVSGETGNPPPRNLILTSGAGQITVRWDAPWDTPEEAPDDHAGYIVQYRALGSTTWIDFRLIIDTEASTATITGLGEGTYEVRVGTLTCEAYCDPPESGQPPPPPPVYAPGGFTAPERAAGRGARSAPQPSA